MLQVQMTGRRAIKTGKGIIFISKPDENLTGRAVAVK
jgi:hypothetical protein